MNNMPAGDRSSDTSSHPIDMNNNYQHQGTVNTSDCINDSEKNTGANCILRDRLKDFSTVYPPLDD
jgi:hypothetical protein